MKKNYDEKKTSINSHNFKKLKLWKFLQGLSIYKFKTFYEIKEILVKYDKQKDYVNYGYWANGNKTENPSRTLVEYVVSKLNLKSDDILLNVGSGMGQPDIDIIDKFSLTKIIGINIVIEQVNHANNKFKSLGLNHLIEHRLINADDILEKLHGEKITCIACIESLAEIINVIEFIGNSYKILPQKGRICFCDVVRIKNKEKDKDILKKISRGLITRVISMLYGDNWRSPEFYTEILKKSDFTNIYHESIGKDVYPNIYRYAKNNFPKLKEKNIPFIFRIFAYLNLYGLSLLFKWGQVDYVVFYGEKTTKG